MRGAWMVLLMAAAGWRMGWLRSIPAWVSASQIAGGRYYRLHDRRRSSISIVLYSASGGLGEGQELQAVQTVQAGETLDTSARGTGSSVIMSRSLPGGAERRICTARDNPCAC